MRKVIMKRPMPVWENTTILRDDGLRQNIGNPTPIDPNGFRPTELTYDDYSRGCEEASNCTPSCCAKFSICGYWFNADQYELSGGETKAFGDIMKNKELRAITLKSVQKLIGA
jgi:hypothetical protein